MRKYFLAGFMVWGLVMPLAFAGAANASMKAAELVQKAGSLFDQGKPQKAIAELKEALKVDPKSVDAFAKLGDVYTAEGKIDQAEIHYLKALELNPNDSRIYNSLGVNAVKQGQGDLALKYFTTAVEKDPKNVAALTNLADFAMAGGQIEIAFNFYEKALAADPANEEVRLKLQKIVDMIRESEQRHKVKPS